MVQEYHEKCLAAGAPVLPDCNLVPLRIDRPIPVTPWGLLLISPLIISVGLLVLLLICGVVALVLEALGLV